MQILNFNTNNTYTEDSIKEKFQKLINFTNLKDCSFEQDANLAYFYTNIKEFEYYKFSRNHILKNFKIYKRTRFSVKLWNFYKIKQNNFLFLNLVDLEIFFFFSFIINSNKKKFLNKWGRLKFFKFLDIKISKFDIYYLYKFLYNLNHFSLFKRRKSIDKQLNNINLFLYNINLSSTFKTTIFFYPVIEIIKNEILMLDRKVTKRPPRLYWSIPRNKIFNAIFKLPSLNSNLVWTNFSLYIDVEKLIFLNKNFFFFCKKKKHEYLFSDKIKIMHYNIKNFFFLKTSLTINYLIIIFWQLINYNNNAGTYIQIFILLFNNNIHNKSEFLKRPLFFTYYNNISTFVRKKYKSKEWFTWAHIIRVSSHWKYFQFYQGFSKSILIRKNFFISSKNFFILNNICNFYNIELKKNFYPKKNAIKKTFFWAKIFSFFSNKWIINRNISEFYLFNKNLFIKSFKILYFNTLIYNLPHLPRLFNNNKLKFNLSIPINFSLFFNKYLRFDAKSSFLNRIFFSNYSSYNYAYFFKKTNFGLYNKSLSCFLILSNFETFFFKKRLIYFPTTRQINVYMLSIKVFTTSFAMMDKKIYKRFKKWLKKKLWLNDLTIVEELDHLVFEHHYFALERAWELIRIKQLAELRLNKLTTYLKKMRQLNIDVGNIQYSPDFTQQHEFALTLKWGLELEMMRLTRYIILKWFFGTNKYPVKTNFFWKKICFLYNLIKTRYKKQRTNFSLTFNYKISKILSLKNVYELTRLQLATIVSTYKNIYKTRTLQLDYFHTHFNIFSETTIYDFYNFFFLIFERHFLVESYKKYYLITKIKKKIGYTKMLTKKIFNWFAISVWLHWNLIFLKNSFSYYFFRIFRSLKKNITKKIKTTYFYNLIHLLVFRFSKSFLLPSSKTLMDYKIFNLEIQDLNIKTSNKSKFFLSWKLLNFDLFDFLNKKINFFIFIKPELNSYYNNFNIYKSKLICISKSNEEFFFLRKKIFTKNDYENDILSINLDYLFWNLLSEFFYDLFMEFFLETKVLKKFNTNNRFKSSNLYSNLTSSSSSFSFFYTLDYNNTILNWNFNTIKIRAFLIEFDSFLKTPKNFKKLILYIWNFFIKDFHYNHIFKKINIYNKYFSINYAFLLYLYKILMNDMLRENFTSLIINSFILRLLDFLKQDNSNFFFKKYHFETFYLWNFIKQLELLLLSFLFEFSTKLLQ